jgi:hypothetical protein
MFGGEGRVWRLTLERIKNLEVWRLHCISYNDGTVLETVLE